MLSSNRQDDECNCIYGDINCVEHVKKMTAAAKKDDGIRYCMMSKIVYLSPGCLATREEIRRGQKLSIISISTTNISVDSVVYQG